jgi:hypothetical protein
MIHAQVVSILVATSTPMTHAVPNIIHLHNVISAAVVKATYTAPISKTRQIVSLYMDAILNQ